MPRLPSELRAPILLAVLAGALHIPYAGSFGLMDPWETHYGETARNMVESGDWISPWWGSYWPEGETCTQNADCGEEEVCQATRAQWLNRPATCRPKEIKREGQYFFSKPVLIMWMMAGGMTALGVNPWGVRLMVLLLGIYVVFMVTFCARRLFGERVAVVSGLVLMSAPFFAILTRQSVTDLPFVGLMAAGMAHLLIALFDDPERMERPAPRAFRCFAVALIALALPQIALVGLRLGVSMRILRWQLLVGPFHAAAYAGGLITFLALARRTPTSRQVHMWAFYLLVGLATLAKGILGFALPGAVVLAYLIVSRDWRQLRRVELVRGPIALAVVAFPWYGAMFARHFHGFYERFFVHDHFKRLASGVHQIDTGGFDHFIFWLGLGLFPWSAFLPAALGREVLRWWRWGRDEPSEARPLGRPVGADAARLLILLWFLVAFTLFTLASTKFHHYIFAAVPPAALLLGLLLSDLGRGRVDGAPLILAAALGLFAWMAVALSTEPQRIINLVTYMYDRKWPPEVDYRRFLERMALIGSIPLVVWLAWSLHLRDRGGRWRSLPLCGFAAFALFFATWTVDRYLPGISPTWSQRGLFDAYYGDCTPVEPEMRTLSGRRICEQRIVSYKMNWRGETYQSDNTVVPLRDDKDFDYFLGTADGKQEFFALVEHSRLQSQFKAKLAAPRRKGVRRVHEGNVKFLLVRVPAASEPAAPEAGPSEPASLPPGSP